MTPDWTLGDMLAVLAFGAIILAAGGWFGDRYDREHRDARRRNPRK